MGKTKKPSKKAPAIVKGKNAKTQELSEEQLDQVAGGTASLTTACCAGKHIVTGTLY